jgi:integrase
MWRQRSTAVTNALPKHMYWQSGRYKFRSPPPPLKWVTLGKDFAAAVKPSGSLPLDDTIHSESESESDSLITLDRLWQRYIDGELFKKARRTIDDLSPADIRKYLDLRGQTATIRANREIALLSSVLNRVREWGMMEQPNPCAGARKHREQGRDRYVSDDELRAVYSEADQAVRNVLDLAYQLGLRVSDLFAMRLTDKVDDLLVVNTAEAKAKLRVALLGELAVFIQQLRASPRAAGVTSILVN